MATTSMAESQLSLEGVSISQADGVLRVTSRAPLRVLGCADVGDDLALTRNIVAMPAGAAPAAQDSEERLHGWALQAGIQEPFVGVLTTAGVDSCVQVTETTPKWRLTVLVFADLAGLCSAGETPPDAEDASGGIDIIILTDASLTMGAMVSAMITATEAKVRALVENRLATSGGHAATGGSADSVVVACLSRGERIRQAGPATQFGYLVGKAVHEGLTRALRARRVS